MVFSRANDLFCPKVWHCWQNDGVTWIIQDLPPEDDEEAVQILVEHLCQDETLCFLSGVNEDPVSLKGIADFWRWCLSLRTSLACYAEVGDTRTLAGLNVCLVKSADDTEEVDEKLLQGKSWQQVYKSLEYIDSKFNTFEYLGLDKVLAAMGLVVKREYRGQKLGVRLLNAREPLSRSLGLKGTSTMFTGPASQKQAERSGFTSVLSVSLRELADAGFSYPRDDNSVVKIMVKKYDP